MSKLKYAKSLDAFKLKYPNYTDISDDSYRSVVYTGDGFIVTHGTVMKTMVSDNPDNPWDLDFTLSNQTATVSLSGVGKSILLPIIDLKTSTDALQVKSTDGIYTLEHRLGNPSWTVDRSVGPADDSNTQILIPAITYDKYGHLKEAGNKTATLNQVYNERVTDTGIKYLTFSNSQTSTTGSLQKCSNIVAVPSTGTLGATVFEQGGRTLDSLYAPVLHATKDDTFGKGTSTEYGHIKLSDSLTSSSDTSLGTAATPKSVRDALEGAKLYADELFTSQDAMIFVGTIDASTEIIVSVNSTIGSKHDIQPGITKLSSLKSYQAGWTFRISKEGTIPGIGKLGNGDILIAVSDHDTSYKPEDWTSIQNTIADAVTSPDDLSANSIVLGDGNKVVKTIRNGAVNQVLKIGSSGAPEWTTNFYSRAIRAENADFLEENTSTPLNIFAGNNVSIATEPLNGRLTITSNDTKYTAGTGLELASTVFSSKLATSIERGAVKIGYASNNKNYAVLLSEEKMYVNVPWTDTKYVIAKHDTDGLIRPFRSYTTNATGGTTGEKTNTVAVQSITETAGRYYGIEMDKMGRAFVNVPWSNITYDYKIFIGAANTAGNSAIANPYLKLFEGSKSSTQHRFLGAGSTSIASDTNGNITFTSTDTWREVNAYIPGSKHSSISIDKSELSFGPSLGWKESQLNIMWAAVDENGNITYEV